MHYLFNLTEVIETVKWHDWLDIFIVAFLLYRCFVLFWGTLVFRAIIVITLFWIFDLIATTLGLIVTSLILKGIGAIIVIIVIVIFRNEIRGVITNTNPLNLIWGKPRRKYIADYESISKAIFSLAENQAGPSCLPAKKQFRSSCSGWCICWGSIQQSTSLYHF